MAIDRRSLLAGTGALGVAAVLGGQAAAQPARSRVVDVHTHMYSRGWVKAVEEAADPTFKIGPNDSLIYRGGSIVRKVPRRRVALMTISSPRGSTSCGSAR